MATEPPIAPAPSSKKVIFLRRFGSTILLWAVVLWTILSQNHRVTDWVFLVLLLTLTALGLREFYSLVGKSGLACFPRWGLVLGMAMVAIPFLSAHGLLTQAEERTPQSPGDWETTILMVAVLCLFLVRLFARNVSSGLQAISTTLLGILYVPWLLNFLARMVFFPGIEGRYYVLYFILVTKFSDLGAYVTGSLIGRHKMIPRVSPGKTWEGLAGAVIISTGASLLFVQFLGEHLAGMTLLHAAILGALLSVAAVFGDLIESLFKREAGVKDSGRLFPGIGGVLDLLDSLLFNAPLMYLYLRYVLG